MRALKSEQGFAMASSVIGMFLATMLVLVAVTAVRGDLNLTRGDLDHKRAYEAAKAGINDYAFHLNDDNSYWTYCTGVPTPNAVNQQGSTAKRRTVPGNTGATYAIELLPATGQSSCNSANPVTSDARAVRTDVGDLPDPLDGLRRQGPGVDRHHLQAGELPRLRLLHPAGDARTRSPTGPTRAPSRAPTQQCSLTWQEGRYDAPIPNSGGRYCDRISFITADSIDGPLHTNDGLAICGSPDFGRTTADRIEVSASAPGWFSTCWGSDPDFIGTYITSAPVLTPPPSNSQLATIAGSPYRFTGQVRIMPQRQLDDRADQRSGTVGPLAFPSNGVVYVANGSCSTSYTPFRAARATPPTTPPRRAAATHTSAATTRGG